MAKTAAQVVVFERDGVVHLRTRSTITLDAAVADAPASSWIQVCTTGSFKKGDRKFAITPAMLSEMVENFSTGRHPVPPTELCIDYEHLSGLESDNPDAGKAAGWVKQLELRADGAEVWARVEWTPPATEKLKAKEYKFISPEFAFNFTTPTMETIGCTLLAAAITNRPFLQGMEPVTLKAGAGDLALVADLSYEQRRMFIERALRARGTSNGCWYYVSATTDTTVVYERSGNGGCQYYRESYSIAADGAVTLGEDAEEVVVSYEPLGAAALRHPGESDMKAITLKAADGKDVQVDEAVFAAAIEASPLVKDLRIKLAVKDSEAAPLLAKVATLEQDVATLKTQAETAQQALVERDADKAVELLVSTGKASAGQKDSLKALYLKDQTLFASVTAGFSTRVTDTEIGSAGAPPAGGTAAAQVVTEVATLKAATPALTVEQATAQVFEKNPTLYARYVKETEQKVGKVGA